MTTTLEWLTRQLPNVKHTKALGWIGEQMVMELLPKDRFIVYKPRKHQCGDLHLTHRATGEFVKLEIKTSRVNKRHKFEFRLRKDDQHGKTDVSHADLVLLMCIYESGLTWFYLIPVSDLGQQKTITIPARINDYQGRYAPYFLTNLKRLELPALIH